MQDTILDELVHPDTLAPLRLQVTRRDGAEVLEGALATGDETFDVCGGIPRFVRSADGASQTVRSFEQKWEKHKYYRTHTGEFYTAWFLQRYGFHVTEGLADCLEQCQRVLDAGTGSGRDAALFAAHCGGTVFGVDRAAVALEIASKDIRHPRVAFVQADLDRLPFPDGYFDFISCDQVIHHLPDPAATFRRLRQKLRTGGQICCYVYRRKAAPREFADDFVRERIRDLPIDAALEACAGITHLGRQLAELNITLDVEHDIPVLGIRKGKIDLQRFFHWNLFKCFWNEEFDFFTNNIINFDWYHPEYCHRYEPDEFRAWFADGWQIESWDVQDAGISCRALKV